MMRWSYALNQWKNGHDRFVLREQHERAFKTLWASGFDAVEIPCGSGRWEPLGRRDWIERFYGSVDGLKPDDVVLVIDQVTRAPVAPAAPEKNGSLRVLVIAMGATLSILAGVLVFLAWRLSLSKKRAKQQAATAPAPAQQASATPSRPVISPAVQRKVA